MSDIRVRESASARSWLRRLNTDLHAPALQIFLVVVLAHWAEHLTQAFQIYALGWPIPEARGVLGIWFPFLIQSELLHYGYAIVMLIGIWALLPGFQGSARAWWSAALAIQVWHHLEHALLLGQAALQRNLFDLPVPHSILQLLFPRVELHLAYNTLVFAPMIVAMYQHVFPRPDQAQHLLCSCARAPFGRRLALPRSAALLVVSIASLGFAGAGCADTAHDPSAPQLQVRWSVAPTPVREGRARLAFSLAEADGVPLSGALVSVYANMRHAGMAPWLAEAEEVGPGQYAADLQFSMAGDWFVRLDTELADGRRLSRVLEVPDVGLP